MLWDACDIEKSRTGSELAVPCSHAESGLTNGVEKTQRGGELASPRFVWSDRSEVRSFLENSREKRSRISKDRKAVRKPRMLGGGCKFVNLAFRRVCDFLGSDQESLERTARADSVSGTILVNLVPGSKKAAVIYPSD